MTRNCNFAPANSSVSSPVPQAGRDEKDCADRHHRRAPGAVVGEEDRGSARREQTDPGQRRRDTDQPGAQGLERHHSLATATTSARGYSAIRGQRLRRERVERLHRQLDVLRLRVLELRVREAAQALDEQHHGRHAGAGDLGGVVQRARRQPVRRAGDLADRRRRRARSATRRRGSARCSRAAPTRPRSSPRPRSAPRRPSPLQHPRELVGVRCRWSSSCSAVSTTDVTIPGRQMTPPDVQTAPSPDLARDVADLERELRRAGERVAAHVHRRRAGVRGLAAPGERERSTPKVPRTTPSGRSSDSSTGPCSMCSSR